jgi:carbamoyl-phosphate synthase small subunit
MERTPGFLLLEDGTLFRGRIVGRAAPTVAEVVFTTNMTGYQEVSAIRRTAARSSYDGADDRQLRRQRRGPRVGSAAGGGVVVRELSPAYSSWRASGGLADWLGAADVRCSPTSTRVASRATCGAWG